jgi:hypothetical protein
MKIGEEFLAKALQDANDRLISAAKAIGDLERELADVKSDLAKARYLLQQCADHADGCGHQDGSDTHHLYIDVRRFIGFAPVAPVE